MLVEFYCMSKVINEMNNISENYDDRSPEEQRAIYSILMTYSVILMISFIVWVFVVVLLIKNSANMPNWAVATSVVALLFLGPIGVILTLVLIYTTSNAQKGFMGDMRSMDYKSSSPVMRRRPYQFRYKYF